jgi:endoglucanase
VFKLDASHPDSDAAGVTAAAMAAASMVFRTADSAYSSTLLTHAEQLYTFADTYRGTYDTSIDDPDTYHSYSGCNDELVWGAIWLYRATGDTAYLDKAVAYYENLGMEEDTTYHKYKWTFNWNDSTHACYILMAKLFPAETKYQAGVEHWLDWWTIGFEGNQVPYTLGGHARLDDWGSLRYAANTAFGAFVYSNWITDATKKARYKDFAEAQINYILGENPRESSYICGFGTNPPQHPHHRTAHGS